MKIFLIRNLLKIKFEVHKKGRFLQKIKCSKVDTQNDFITIECLIELPVFENISCNSCNYLNLFPCNEVLEINRKVLPWPVSLLLQEDEYVEFLFIRKYRAADACFHYVCSLFTDPVLTTKHSLSNRSQNGRRTSACAGYANY